MSGLYNTFKVFSPGEILSAADLNASEQQHVVYNTAAATSGYSGTLAESRIQTESTTLAVSMADELARLREKIRLLGGEQYWDQVTGPALTPAMPRAQILLPLEGAILPDGTAGNLFPTITERISSLAPATGSPKLVEVVYDFAADQAQFIMWKVTTPLGYRAGEIIECVCRVSMVDNVIIGNLKIVAGIAPIRDDTDDVTLIGVTMSGSDAPVPTVWKQQHEYRIPLSVINVTENQKCVIVIGMTPASTSNATGPRRLETATAEFSRGLYDLPDPGMPNPMTTIGDIVVGGNSGSPTRLPIGAINQVLTVDPTNSTPQWINAVAGFTNPMNDVGDLIQGGALGAAARLSIGAENQVLTVVSAVPKWIDSPALVSPLTIDGDLLSRNLGIHTRVGIGTPGQILTVVGGLPTWQAPLLENPMTAAQDLIVGGLAGAMTRFPVGLNAQVLTIVGGAITWSAPTGGMNNPMTTLSDVIVGGASGIPTRLGIGANTQVLTVVGGVPTWQAPLSGGMTNPMTAVGDIIVGATAGAPARLGPGTNGHILTLIGGTPTWQAPSGGGFPLLAPDGTYLAPSYSFAGNQQMGMYRSGGSLLLESASDILFTLGSSTIWGMWSGALYPEADSLTDLGAQTKRVRDLWLSRDIDFTTLASAPATPPAGHVVVYGKTDKKLYQKDDAGVESLLGSTFTNPMTSVGDIIRGGTSGAPTRLAVGTNGHFLTLTAGIPAWSALPVDPGFANPMTTLGDVIIGGASGAPGRLGIGTTGHVLTVVAGAPAWAASAGGGAKSFPLPIEGATLPTGAAGNAIAEFVRDVSTGTLANAPFPTRTYARFDQDVDEHLEWGRALPADYVSGGTLRLKWRVPDGGPTTGNVIWKAGVRIMVDGTTVDTTVAFAAVNLSAASAAPGTMGTVREATIALTMTNAAAGRYMTLFVGRDADNGTDTMTHATPGLGDAVLMSVVFEYA